MIKLKFTKELTVLKDWIERETNIRITTKGRNQQQNFVRSIFYTIARKEFAVSYFELGQFTNKRNHATVYHALSVTAPIALKNPYYSDILELYYNKDRTPIFHERNAFSRLKNLFKKIYKENKRLHQQNAFLNNKFFDYELRVRELSPKQKESFSIKANAILNMMQLTKEQNV